MKDGDIIDIDIENCAINLRVSEEEIEKRRAAFKPLVKPVDGYLARYRASVTSASEGAIFRK